jgi:hypothetical protein
MKHTRSLVMALLLVDFVIAGCGDSSSGTAGDGGGGRDGQAAGGAGGGTGGTGAATGGSGGAATGGSGAGTGGSSGGTGGAATGGTTGSVPITCASASPQCNDGMDNDGDGKIDSVDPECVGACDNDEGSFATGIPGDNVDACKQDCFFDGNSGMGDDGCEWNLKCDKANPGGMSCPYDMNFNNCPTMQSDRCIRNCRKLTPNGCDCFGCCAVPVGNQVVNVRLGGSCTADKFGDPTACPRCTQNMACVNTCEKCEVCLGKPAPDPSCTPATPDGGAPAGDAGSTDAGTPVSQCPVGQMSCGPGGQVPADGCGAGQYCTTGCCVRYTID